MVCVLNRDRIAGALVSQCHSWKDLQHTTLPDDIHKPRWNTQQLSEASRKGDCLIVGISIECLLTRGIPSEKKWKILRDDEFLHMQNLKEIKLRTVIKTPLVLILFHLLGEICSTDGSLGWRYQWETPSGPQGDLASGRSLIQICLSPGKWEWACPSTLEGVLVLWEMIISHLSVVLLTFPQKFTSTEQHCQVAWADRSIPIYRCESLSRQIKWFT